MQQTTAGIPSKWWVPKDIIHDFRGSPIERVSKDWMLITAGTKSDYNSMTASWGSFGYMWEKRIVTVMVRPTRLTYAYMEGNDRFSLTFFGKKERGTVHKVCGSESGRDINKAEQAGITPIFFEDNEISFEEANETIICKKLYYTDLDPKNFLDPTLDSLYNNDYHRIYVGEIIKFYQKLL